MKYFKSDQSCASDSMKKELSYGDDVLSSQVVIDTNIDWKLICRPKKVDLKRKRRIYGRAEFI